MIGILKDSARPWYRFATSKYYREYFRLFSTYNRYPRYQPTDIRFLDYNVQVADALSFIYQYREIFIDNTYKLGLTKKNPVIYDCGANIGISCLYFKRLFPDCTLKAFEADPTIYAMLVSNVQRNLPANNVEFYNQAVWIDNEGVEFAADGADGGSILGNSTAKRVRVASVRLKDLIQREAIDFLKIDIEGAEVPVILDCDGSLGNVDKMFLEYHSFTAEPQRLHDVLAVLQKNGFRYFIQSADLKKEPFLHLDHTRGMDLQLNIYCYRK